MKKHLQILFLIFISVAVSAQDIYINEVNYLSNGQKFIEIAGPPQTDLSDYEIVLYDENGNPYGTTIELSGLLPETTTCNGIVDVDVPVLLNVPGAGMAVVNQATNQTIQYLSYGGATTIAMSGPAVGITSDNIGTQIVEDLSLQLTGIGESYPDFAWTLPGAATPDETNLGQTFDCPAATGVLPVELVNFRGALKGSEIQLTWQTLSEVNHSHFEIMYSTDGISFENIDKVVNPEYTSGASKYYTFKITRPSVGVNYFKLIQVDNDGTTAPSNIINVTYQSTGNGITTYPNPVTNRLNLRFDSLPDFKSDVIIRVIDSSGKSIVIKNINNQNELYLNVDQFDVGIYFVHIQYRNQSWKTSFVKQKF